MSNKRTKGRPMNNPRPNDKYIMVKEEEIVRLIRATTERDVLLNAYANGCDPSRMKDIFEALCKINEIEVKKC